MTILVEKHERDCTFGDPGHIHYGLNIPPAWNKWNAWYVIKWAPRRYIRWTNSWLRVFA